MNKHTKGEWEIDGNSIFPKGKSYSIAIVSNISIVNSKLNPNEETKANAKLIAAAPDLLEAINESPDPYKYDTMKEYLIAWDEWNATKKSSAIKKASE